MQYFVSMMWMLYGGLIILVICLVAIGVWMFREYFAIKGHFDPYENLIGEKGTVKQECSPHKKGKVHVMGAYWDAVSEFGTLKIGDDIRVVGMKDKLLVVSKIDVIAE